MTIEFNVFNMQEQPMGFGTVQHSTFNLICDFCLEEVEFNHEEELISYVYESFPMEYKPQYDTLAFDD